MDPARLDISSEPKPDAGGKSPPERKPRPFLGIQFKCCHTYGRIYRNDAATKYEGQCPKCRAKVSVPIGSGGTGARFFEAG